jgi:DNA polymerase III delta prime subunit
LPPPAAARPQLNASDDRGIDVVREQIKSFAGTRKLFSTGVKLVVLDEADAMTQDAQFALRRGAWRLVADGRTDGPAGRSCGLSAAAGDVGSPPSLRPPPSAPPLPPPPPPPLPPAVIEKYARNTRFCLICNYVSKIIPALQSRCTRFRFAPLAKDAIQSRLGYIVDKEGLSQRLTPEGNRAVLALGGGDMRKVLNILQSSASGYDVIDEDAVYAVTGNPRPAEVREALGVLLKGSFIDGYKRECAQWRGHAAAAEWWDVAVLVARAAARPSAHGYFTFYPTRPPNTPRTRAAADIQALSLRGYAVSDLLTELSRYTVALSLPPGAKAVLLDKLADVECVTRRGVRWGTLRCCWRWWAHRRLAGAAALLPRSRPSSASDPPSPMRLPLARRYRLAFGTSDKLQTASLVAAYHGVRVLSKQATSAGGGGGAS